MFLEYEEQIRQEAINCYPEEGVWLITRAGCKQVTNIHEDPENFFKVGITDRCQAESEGLLAVVHSHPDRKNVPSASDMTGQVNTGVPWGILTSAVDSASAIRWWGTDERQPLLGRPFVHGVTDCYALVRDYYKTVIGVDLPEYPRDWEWWNKGQDLLMDGFSSAGFRRIEPSEVKPDDVWLARIRGNVIHHCGILLDNSLMMHQIGNPGRPVDASRLSSREPIGRYLKYIQVWLRYEK